MRRTLRLTFAGALAALALAAGTTSTEAQPGGLIINMTFALPIPASHGKDAHGVPGSGTFTIDNAAGTQIDSGTISLVGKFAAIPAPHTAVLTTKRTLIGADGTISLSCTERVTPRLFEQSLPGELLNKGTCAVTAGSGAYAGLHGSGLMTGIATPTSTILSNTETLTLRKS